MAKFTKTQIAVLLIIAALIIGGIIYFLSLPKEKIEKIPEKEVVEEELPQVFSLSAIISEIDIENKFLIVKTFKEGQELKFKVILSEGTKITRLKFPFDPKRPPKEATFTLEKILIGLRDLKIDDHLFIETTQNIYGQTEFDHVSQIQVLP